MPIREPISFTLYDEVMEQLRYHCKMDHLDTEILWVSQGYKSTSWENFVILSKKITLYQDVKVQPFTIALKRKHIDYVNGEYTCVLYAYQGKELLEYIDYSQKSHAPYDSTRDREG